MDDDGNDCCVKDGKGRGIVFVGVLAVFLLSFVGIVGNNVGWFEEVISDNSDSSGQVVGNQSYDPVDDKPVVDSPVNDNPEPVKDVDTPEPVVDTRVTVMTSNGEIKGMVVKAGPNYGEYEIDGERLPDYYYSVWGAWESVYKDKGLLDVFNKYDIKNHAIEKINTDGKPGYNEAKVFLNVGKDNSGRYDFKNSGMLVYDGEISKGATSAISYIVMCTEETRNEYTGNPEFKQFEDGCKKWL